MKDMPYIDSRGRKYQYGDYFPVELSPFAYNESTAYQFFPLSREQILEQGFSWKESDQKKDNKAIRAIELEDHIDNTKEDICQKIIICQHEGKCEHQCTFNYKITPQELKLYKRMNVPLPRICPNCRHYERANLRNGLSIWHRQCMCTQPDHKHQGRCGQEFETTYSPDRKELVYCEDCYLSAVI